MKRCTFLKVLPIEAVLTTKPAWYMCQPTGPRIVIPFTQVEPSGKATTLEELEAFLDRVGGFHDGILKEIHWVNDDFVGADLTMHPWRGASLRMLVQRQWANPAAVEITLHEVQHFTIDTRDFIFTVIGSQDGEFLTLHFDGGSTSTFTFRTLEYRFADGWLGPELRFTS